MDVTATDWTAFLIGLVSVTIGLTLIVFVLRVHSAHFAPRLGPVAQP